MCGPNDEVFIFQVASNVTCPVCLGTKIRKTMVPGERHDPCNMCDAHGTTDVLSAA